MRKFLWLAAPLALALGVVAAACGGDDKKTIDVPGGGEVEVGGDIPDGFPDNFPVYDGADVTAGYRGEQEGNEGFFVSWETDDDLDDVQAFYEEELDKNGWELSGTFSSGDGVVLSATHAADKLSGGVTIGEADGKTSIAAFVGDDTSATSDGSDDDEDTPDDAGDDSSDDEDTPDDAGSDDGASSGDAELPDEVELDDNYPEDEIPLPDDARVTSSSSFSSGGQTSVFVQMYVQQSPADIEDFYTTTLEGAGYAEVFRTSSEGSIFLTYNKDADGFSGDSAIVNIAESDVTGYADVQVTISSAPPSGE
jgi:hypothetical protein